MASFTHNNNGFGRHNHIHTWTLTTADHTGDAVEMPGAADRSVQFADTSSSWGSATAALEGSNDGVVYAVLNDPLGNALSFTDDGIKQVLENVRYIRPRLTTVGTAASVTCTLLSKSG